MEYKWKALSVTAIGALMAAVDSTVVLLALFPMAADLNSDFVTMIWVIIAYLVVNTALVLSLGRLADMHGRKLLYNVGFVVFTIGSALCGFAPNGLSLVGFRVVQGTGAALLTSNSFAILSEAFPRNETGRAFGVQAVVWGLGNVLGVIIGGVIITYTTWRWIFLINVPIGIVGTLWAYRTLRTVLPPKGQRGTFDLPAAVAFTAGLLSLLLGITWGLLYSWQDATALTALALSPLIFAVFIAWEAKFSKDPILDFGFFRNRVFAFSLAAALLQFLAVFSVNFLLIFYLEGIEGLSALESAYLIIPFALAAATVGPIGGILTDRFGFRRISILGLAIGAASLLLFSQLTVNSTLLEIGIIETISGVGLALFWPANTSAIMSSTPPAKYGVGSGTMNTFRNTGGILSFALSLTAATSVIPPGVVYQLFIGNLSGKLPTNLADSYLSGQSFAFEISAALVVVALVIVALTKVGARPIVSEETLAPTPVQSSAGSTGAQRERPLAGNPSISFDGEGRNSFEVPQVGRGRKMANSKGDPSPPQERQNEVRRLIQRSRILEFLTFVAVILISPVSFILGIPFGIAPHDWLATWTHWTVVFITLAFFVALLGFEGALISRLKANRISKAASS